MDENKVKSIPRIRKKEDSLYARFGPIRLNWDSIDSIIENIQSIQNDGEIDISVGNYKISDPLALEDLKGQRFQDMDISFGDYSPYRRVTIDISESNSSLRANPPTPEIKGVFLSLRDLLEANRRRWTWIETPFYIILGLGSTSSIFVLFGRIDENPIFTQIGLSIVGLIIFTIFIYVFTIPLRKSEIVILRESDIQSFWIRNKDRLIVALLSSLVSFALGIIGTLLIQSLIR